MSAVGYLALAALGWSGVGYPVVLGVLAGRARLSRSREPGAAGRSVSLIIAAANEAATIEDKLRASLRLPDPASLQIICAVNGSCDGTAARARALARSEPRLEVIETAVLGKTAAQNLAVQRARGEILVFTDANTELAPAAIEALLAEFDDPRVDVVQGVLTLRPAGALRRRHGAEALYWRYESWIRRQEGKLGRAFAASGALLALRRAGWRSIPAHQMEDIVLPLRALAAGRRSVVAPKARATEIIRDSDPARAHRRIALQDSAVVLSFLRRQAWRRPALALQLLSRKLLRWLGLPLYALALVDLGIGELHWGALLLWLPLLCALLGPRAGGIGTAARHAWGMHWWAFVGLLEAAAGKSLPGWRAGAAEEARRRAR